MTVKGSLQGALKQVGLYERLRASWVYDFYWGVADRERIIGRSRELSFYHELLRGLQPGDLVFDIGANIGEKTDLLIRLGARVVAVEPDSAAQQTLSEKFLRYRLTPKPVVIVDKAVSDTETVQTMWIDGDGSALNTFSTKWVEALKNDKARLDNGINQKNFQRQKQIETTTLEHLISQFGVPFYIKIDVEGHELSVIRGLRHVVPYLSFEINLPEFMPEGLECIRLLSQLSRTGKFNYAGDCQEGLRLKEWLGPEEFPSVFEQCSESSVEVYWSTLVNP